MLLDGAWRMLHGQRPHIDFYSHVGVLTFAPTAIGMWLTHGRPAAFGYGQALTGLALGIWSYLLCRKRMHDVPAILMSLAVTLMATTPSILGFPPLLFAPAMTYNRAGYALFALILVETFIKNRDNSQPGNSRGELAGGISTGLALGLLLFLKITYFVFAVFFLAVMAFTNPETKRRWAGLLVAFAAVFLACSAYFSFNLKPMFVDLATVAGSKRLHMTWYLLDAMFEQAGVIIVLCLLGSWLLYIEGRKQDARALSVGGLLMGAIGVVLITGNYEQSGFPMGVFLAIIVADLTIRHTRHAGSGNAFMQAPRALVLLFSSVFVVVFLASQTSGAFYAIALKVKKGNHTSGLHSNVLATFVPIEGDEPYSNFVNDGLDLLQKYRQGNETVMSLDFTNPFSYGVGAKPAAGGNTVMQYRTTFDDSHRQTPQSLFGSADLVMLPRPGHFSDTSLEYSIVPLYGAYLKSHFTLVDETKEWQLYRRNQ